MIRSIAASLFFAISLSATVINVPADQVTTQARIDAAPNADCDVCLKTSPDRNLNWNAETVYTSSLRDEEGVYHDGSFEGVIGCGGCAFSVRFTAATPIFLTGLTLFTQGGDATAAVVSIYADPSSVIMGPPTLPLGPNDGTAVWESAPMDLTTVNDPTSQFDIILDNLAIDTGDYYVVVWEDNSGFLGMANDLQSNFVDRNWVYSDNGWETINDAVGGDPQLTGNFGISTQYLPQEINGPYISVYPQYLNFGVLQIADGPVTQDVTISNLGMAAFDVISIDVVGEAFNTTTTTPFTVQPGESVSMDVVVTPTIESIASGTFTITSTAANITEIVINTQAMVLDGFPIVITEIMQNPSAVSDDIGEWFEIYNTGYLAQDLNGWEIKDAGSDSHIISADFVINPGEYKVLGTNSNSSVNGGVDVDYQYSGITLSNSVDELILLDNNGTIIDSVAYDGGVSFPDPSGASMALVNPDSNNTVGPNWQQSTIPFGDGDFGTPGLPNYLSNITTDPMLLEFDTVFVAESSVLSLTISNDGNAPLLIDSIYTSSSLFDVSFTDSLIETTADLQITFTPAEFGDISAVLFIESNDPDNGLVEIPLSGFGYYLSPDIELESTSIDFGGVMDGLTAVEVFHIYNMGEGVLGLDSIYCTQNFTVSETNGIVAPGDSLALEISFSPDDEIAFSGVLTIVAGNDPDEDTLTVSLLGVGTAQAPIMTLSDTELYFGVVVPNQTVTRQITIYNEGMLDLEIEELTMTGSDLFTTTFSDASVVPGDSVVVEFQFLSAEPLNQALATAQIVAAGVATESIALSAGYFGPIWHVSTNGNNETGDGSEGNPFATIQYGINSIPTNDTLLVSQGTYFENLEFLGRNIVVGSHYLISSDSAFIPATIIDGQGQYRVVTFQGGSNSAALIGFTITNGFAPNNDWPHDAGGGIFCENASPKLSNLIVSNNFASAQGGGIELVNSNSLVAMSTIKNNTSTFIGGGIHIRGGNNLITGNLIAANSGGSGIAVSLSGNAEIANNTLVENDGGGIYLRQGSNANVISSIIFNNGSSEISMWGDDNQQGSTISISYSNVLGGEESITITHGNVNSSTYNWLDGNIDTDPQFCDPESGDYHLSETSPMIGAGEFGGTMGALGPGCGPSFDVPPVISTLPDTSLYEDGTLSFGIEYLQSFIEDPDTPTDGIQFQVFGTDNLLTQLTTGILSVGGSENWFGFDSILVVVSDAWSSDSTFWHFEVLPVNDAPAEHSLTYPDDGSMISDPDSTELTFQWSEAIDVEGDAITYTLLFSTAEWDSSFNTNIENSIRLNIESFPRSEEITWKVWAFDVSDSSRSAEQWTFTVHEVVGVDKWSLVPEEYALHQNYPNPFNPSTTIRYGLPEEANVSLVIYDVRGQVVQTLKSEHQSAGWYDVVWNGQTADGKTISTGIYFARLVAGEYSQVIKMLYLK